MTKAINEKTPAIIYARISSLKQASDGDGLNSQEHRCRQYAEQKGYRVEAVFPDSITGGGDYLKRPGMVALLSYLDAKPHKRFVVIFDDLKRLARDTAAHIALRNELASRGAIVESLNFKFEESPEGKFIETIIAAQGQLEREQNSRQVVQKMKARVEKGFWVFKAPVGMKYVPAKGGGKVLVRDEPLASICQEALEGFASNRFASQTEMRRWLEAQPEFPKDKPDGQIRPQTIVRFLGKEVYAGLVSAKAWNVSLRDGQHDGLISVATYERIQRKLREGVYAATRVDTNEDFVLRGAVACSECGHNLTAGWCKGKNKRYPYYFCVNTSCSRRSKTIPRDKIEGEFADFLGQLQPSPMLIKVATAMFTDLWNNRLRRAEEIANAHLQEAEDQEREINVLLDRIVHADNNRVIKAYEDRIVQAEQNKRVALEKASVSRQSSIPFETLIKHYLKYLASPKTLWDSGVLELRRLVLKLTFTDHIHYCRETGIKHPEVSAPFKFFNHIKDIGGSMINPNSKFAVSGEMVPRGRIELPTSSLPMMRSTTELPRPFVLPGISLS